uniref:C-type lectin domain-containing protein n=1 Tax=Stegastes partitus TaxID=144197 RepID=A0A3B4Z2S4_9TELE
RCNTIFVLFVGTSSSQRCPPDWREIQSKCYFLSTEMKTWEDSRKYCQRNGSDLVVINSQQEQVLCSSSRAIYRLDRDMYLLFWIGLKGTNRVFRWVDGSILELLEMRSVICYIVKTEQKLNCAGICAVEVSSK